MKITNINFALYALIIGLFLTFSHTTRAATFVVTKTADTNGTCVVGNCSLREAIAAANASADDDTINFAAALAGQTITLAGTQLTIADNSTLTIDGLATGGVTVSGGNGTTNNNRVFSINNGATVTINNLTIRNGRVTNDNGGGIYNIGTLKMNNSTLSNNSVSGYRGGAIYNSIGGSVTLSSSTVSYNSAGDDGGGIENGFSGVLTLINSTVSNNSATSGGGGIDNFNGNITLINSTVRNNSAFSGGGIENVNSTLTLNNSTVSNNSARIGGGISNGGGSVTLSSSTVSNNSAYDSDGGGGGIYNSNSFQSGGTLTLSSSTVSNNSARIGGGIYNRGITNLDNTIIANSTGGDCNNSGDTISASYSLIEEGLACVNGTNSNNLTGDPNLGPLANNGGATQTHRLLPGSIAIDKGNSTFSTDQRGSFRPVDDLSSPNGTGNLSDIGSFEVLPLTVDTIADDANLSACIDVVLNDCSLRGAIARANATATNETIDFADALAGQTITLTTGTQLTIANNGTLTINGLTTNGGITVSGSNGTTNNNRVFLINSGATAAINNLTIRNGRTVNPGGGIYNGGILTLSNSTVINNSAGSDGGGIENGSGVLTLINSTVTYNSARNGGGIGNFDGKLTLINSTVSTNSVTNSGGGGGGIFNSSGGSVTLSSSTVNNNLTTGSGGGIFNVDSSTINLDNTIIANSVGGDCFRTGGTVNASYSLIEEGMGCVNGTSSNNLTGDPNLAPLDNNGGPTQTHALLSGSIAIDKGNSILTTDQRGFARPVDYPYSSNGTGNLSDIGAFELQLPPATHFSVSAPANVTAGQQFTFTVTALDANNNPVTGYTGTVHFTSSDPQAVLPADATLMSGTGTFSATLKTAGTQTITATDTQNSSIAGTSNNIQVAAAAAAGFVVTAPAAATPGTVFQFTVRAVDSFGNTATAYSGTVRFTSTDPNAVLPANATLTNGAGTFSATLNSYGSQTVTATDTANTAIKGTSNQITVKPAAGQSIVVTRADERNTSCRLNDCSLREAIAAANASPADDTITFNIPNCANNTCTIRLSGGELQINSTSTAGKLTITNTGSTMKIVVSGNNTSRVFFVSNSANLTLDSLTVTGGNGAGIFGGRGGGIYNSSSGTLTLTNSTVAGNSATNGGGIFNNQDGTLTLTNSTVSGNSTTGGGGGTLNFGTAMLTNSTVSGNTANGDGGGIYNNSSGPLTLTNSTVAGNSASGGGGGIYIINGAANLSNTIVADNTGTNSAPNISGTVASQGYNLIGNSDGANITAQTGDQIGTSANPIDPKLASLADNLGPTQTRALLSGSPAIDKGNSTLTTDQRGATRPIDDPNSPNGTGNLSDIGAFEVQLSAPTAATVSVSGRALTADGRGICNVMIRMIDAAGTVRVAYTTTFGYYGFTDVAAGETYIFTVQGKRFQFTSPTRILNVFDDTTDVNFIAASQ